jgi:Skp family chaperone for outer membrane proteins
LTDATARSAEVKKSRPWAIPAAVVLLGCLGYASWTSAQAPVAAPSAGGRMALLDVSRIFKNHQRFKSMLDQLKADADQAEAKVKSEREAMGQLVERMQEYRKGTPEYKQMEEELAKRQADLTVGVNLQKNDFMQREAKIYHSVYQEIWEATDYFCKQHQIDMVLRFNGEPVDVERPDSVLAHINKPVVWYDQGLDITDLILKDLNKRSINPNSNSALRPSVPLRK